MYDKKNIINLKKLNFKLFSHKTYVNIVFCNKYLNVYLDIMVNKCVT